MHDALTRAASRTLPALRHAASALWPRFTSPILAGTHSPKEFSKLLVASRLHFQDERLLDPGIVTITTTKPPSSLPGPPPATTPIKPTNQPAHSDLTALLPSTARLLLLASYLASHNAPRHDLTLFSTHHHGRRRRRGGGLSVHRNARRNNNKQHRKIARKLLGAHAFVLERMLAIFASVRREWDDLTPQEDDGWNVGMDGDVGMAIATLASLRLLVRVGGGGGGADVMDRGGKWRVNVGWEVVRGLGRSMGVEVEEWLVEG